MPRWPIRSELVFWRRFFRTQRIDGRPGVSLGEPSSLRHTCQVLAGFERQGCRVGLSDRNWCFGVAFFGLSALMAGPAFPWENLHASDTLAKCWQDLSAKDAALAYQIGTGVLASLFSDSAH